MKITLTYFKPSGKYYSEGKYESHAQNFAVPQEVIDIIKEGDNPGLQSGSCIRNEFSVLISGEDIPPTLISPRDYMSTKTLDFIELKRALMNIGFDLACGACASLFYTGHAVGLQHDHHCFTVRRND